MRELHYHPGNASLAPHILLEAIGVPYRRVLVDRARGAHKQPDYLRLNPNGLIPVLVDDGDGAHPLVLYESAAICLHLCDAHPQAGLAPAFGTRRRAHFYKWLVWLTNTLQATLIPYFYPERWVEPGNAEGTRQVRQAAAERVGGLLDILDAELARHGGPWLLAPEAQADGSEDGGSPATATVTDAAGWSAVDAYALMLCRWTRGFDGAVRPARERPQLGPYLQRLLAVPAVQRVFAHEGIAAPLV